jgi:hypothetical protein
MRLKREWIFEEKRNLDAQNTILQMIAEGKRETEVPKGILEFIPEESSKLLLRKHNLRYNTLGDVGIMTPTRKSSNGHPFFILKKKNESRLMRFPCCLCVCESPQY